MITLEDLHLRHKRIPGDYYDRGIRQNLLQRYWHIRRFQVVGEVVREVCGRLLDVGCAGGTFTEVLERRAKGVELVAIDISEEAVRYGAASRPHINFALADGHALPFKDGSFDAITCLEVMEHVYRPEQILAEIARCLKERGILILLVPTESLLFKIVWLFWLRFKGKVWDSLHVSEFHDHQLEALVVRNGLSILERQKFHLGMLVAIKAEKLPTRYETPSS